MKDCYIFFCEEGEPRVLDEVRYVSFLSGVKNAIKQITIGKSDVASQRVALIRLLDGLGYVAPHGMKGTLHDLRSETRLNLILDTNVAIIWCYRQWREGNEVLIGFPAQEWAKFGHLGTSYPWHEIWDEARAKLPATTATHARSTGRLVAMKNDPIWMAISDFGLPWPPFKPGFGMFAYNVDWDVAVDLGVMKEQDEPTQPPTLCPYFERYLREMLGEIDELPNLYDSTQPH